MKTRRFMIYLKFVFSGPLSPFLDLSLIRNNTNLNCFEQNLSRTSDAMRFVDALKVGLGDDLTELALGPPVWKIWATKSYKRFNQAAETVHELTSKMVEKAKIESNTSSDYKGSILQKLIMWTRLSHSSSDVSRCFDSWGGHHRYNSSFPTP